MAKRSITIRVSEEELSLWKAEARQQGLTLTGLIRLRVSGRQGGLSEQIRVSAEREVAQAVRRQVPEEAHAVVRGEIEELLDERLREAVESQSLDPAEVMYRLGQVEQAVANVNRAVQSGQVGASPSSVGDESYSEPFIDSP